MPAPPGMFLGPSMLSISSTLSHAVDQHPASSADASGGSATGLPPTGGGGSQGSFSFHFSRGGTAGGGGGGAGGMSASGFPQYPNVPLGEFGAPLTASPSNRPMMKLPERALHALDAASASGGTGVPGNVSR